MTKAEERLKRIRALPKARPRPQRIDGRPPMNMKRKPMYHPGKRKMPKFLKIEEDE